MGTEAIVSSAVRMRVLRRRRRQGLVPMRLEVDELRLAGALIAAKRLTPDETLRRAKKVLNVRAEKDRAPDGKWYWILPDDPPV